MLHADDLARVSWQCVHFEEQRRCEALSRAAQKHGLPAPRVHGSALTSKERLLAGLAAALRFPSYCAPNWDAFDECIRDLEWLPESGCLLLLSGSAALWQQSPRLAGELVSSWLSAAEYWARDDVPLHLVFLF